MEVIVVVVVVLVTISHSTFCDPMCGREIILFCELPIILVGCLWLNLHWTGEVRAEKKPECLRRWGVLRTQSSGLPITLFSDLALLKLCHLAQKGQPPTSSSHRCPSFSPQRCLFLQPWVFREQLPDLLKAPQGHCVGELSGTFLYNQGPVILACMLSHFSCVLLFCDHMDCSPPGSYADEILQARILE